jgi:hypothetical protein
MRLTDKAKDHIQMALLMLAEACGRVISSYRGVGNHE